ncbi:hypothetical protein PsYK624_100440 [Phanerochaete sordida]|uniref:DUF7330 domain-containing protein n=1 Tax=Phanerochaete sordida TaxID=48140 RepID=A0A9P3LGQ5_9APHY|nr:hypothetical protein PsYK624_100440 [Phanerochaete sordida]
MIIEKAELAAAEPAAPYASEKAFGAQGVPPPAQEQPPPYEGASMRGIAAAALGPARVNSIFQSAAQQHANFITLESKHNEISGSYIINPELAGSASAHTRMLDRRERKKLQHNIVPNAAFKTKHGRINLNLATDGNTDQLGKAYVQIVTRHGRVNVNLFALQANKNVFLEIVNKDGPINLLIPPTFNGLFRISNGKHGGIHFLPGFAARARVVFADDEHADILFGKGDLSLVEPTSEGVDYCSITSCKSYLTLGVSGVDHVDTAAGSSLMKKLGAMVLGPDLMRTVETLRAELLREHGTPTGPFTQTSPSSSV